MLIHASRVRLGSSHAMECVQCATIAKPTAAGVPMSIEMRLGEAVFRNAWRPETLGLDVRSCKQTDKGSEARVSG